MISLTKKEQEALLILFKEFTIDYNANSLSKKLKISSVGALKILNRLNKANLTNTKTIGKSIIHKLNLTSSQP